MRFDESAVKAAAKRLIRWHDQIWYHLADDLREALVDMTVMDSLRLADDDAPVTPAQLGDFRARLVRALADGVFVGRTRRGLMFERDRAARRELLAHKAGTVGDDPLPR